MGGSAFQALVGKEAFPRLPPAVYRALKTRVRPVILGLYSSVTIPVEAPEKVDYGDLDLLVAGPKLCPVTKVLREVVPHALVQGALGAKLVIPMEGNKTSNYAIPVEVGEWELFGHLDEERAARSVAPNSEIYYQVDVHVCNDKAELDRFTFFHSYGDMGMMLGLIARNSGLRLGVTGLKIPVPNQPPFFLSDLFDEILPFLGLSKEVYEQGFKAKLEVFQWVTSMQLFEPRVFRSTGNGLTRVKEDRKMYAEFVSWVETKYKTGKSEAINRDEINAQVQERALSYFNKAREYEALVTARSERGRLRKVFCGHNIRDWTKMGEYWKGVKMIMDAMREEMGGESAILQYVDEKGEDELRTIAIQVRDRLGLSPTLQDEPSPSTRMP